MKILVTKLSHLQIPANVPTQLIDAT